MDPEENFEDDPQEKETLLTEEYLEKFVIRLLHFKSGTTKSEDIQGIRDLVLPEIYDALTHYENPLYGDIPEENVLPKNIAEGIFHGKVGITSFPMTVIVGKKRGLYKTKEPILDVYTAHWKIIEKTRGSRGWDYILQKGDTKEMVNLLKVNISFNSQGEINSRVECHSGSGFNIEECDCVVFEGINEKVTNEKLKFFLSSRGDTPKHIQRYSGELKGIFFFLRNAIEEVNTFLENISKRNYYDYRNAVNDVITEVEGTDNWNTNLKD